MKENYPIYLPYQFHWRPQSALGDPQLPNKKMKTLFLWNMLKSRRLTLIFFPDNSLSLWQLIHGISSFLLAGKKYSKIIWEYLSAPHVCCLEDKDRVVPDEMVFPVWTSFASHPPADRYWYYKVRWISFSMRRNLCSWPNKSQGQIHS